MNRSRALGASLATLALASTLIACSSQTPGSNTPPKVPAAVSCPPNDNDYSWCSNQPNRASAPAGGGHASSKPPSGAVRWGDWKFGDCALSLYPAYVGLTMHPSGNLVILASTACVGFQPREIHVHIALQRWWAPGGIKHDWHDSGTVLSDSKIPPLVLLPPDGDPPLSEQHQIRTGIFCTPDATQQNVPYRLRIDILGVSYSGQPIVTGGYTSPLIISGRHCN